MNNISRLRILILESISKCTSRLIDPVVIKEIRGVPQFRSLRVLVLCISWKQRSWEYIDEVNSLSSTKHDLINKHNFSTPFICGCRDIGKALGKGL
ncbi:hypothetical protein VitviT2T_013440 [Vitis vinifera]|uniref:PdxS/SNZ N-terminal domain-containing protein n=1 Tax=Vitis vinifera TaxID=29760 RepID=A0ABY9CJ79_VITVI|nr:hypothetical protein VitviT2T_013440 [Vitis vinifera]